MFNIITLTQSDNTEITVILKGSTPEEAAEIAINNANNQVGKSQVITSKKPLKVKTAIAWEDKPLLRVTPGNNCYAVRLFVKDVIVKEFSIEGVASVKSAFAKVVKDYNLHDKSVVLYLYDLSQVPQRVVKKQQEVRLTEEQRRLFETFVETCEKFKNCYFWGNCGNTSTRKYNEEKYSIPEYITIINGDTYSVQFIANYYFSYVTAKSYVFKNREKSNITVIKNLLAKDLNHPQALPAKAI